MSEPKSVYLVHWNEREAQERAERLADAGYDVRFGCEHGGVPARDVKRDPPDAVVIDLGRLPSHGRQMAVWMRETRATRRIPLVFVGGPPEKVARVRRDFPDAVYATWRSIRSALRAALRRPVKEPLAPHRPDYSGTPLPKKLGIREGARVALLGAPTGFAEGSLDPLPPDVKVRNRTGSPSDVAILFARSRADLARRFDAAARSMADGGTLWVAWPKKTSGSVTDLDKDVVQRHGLESGLVDNKVCAIDATWSGLRFARRRR